MRKISLRVLALLVILVFSSSLTVQAQSNLLTNGGLDEGGDFGPYTGRRGGEFPIYLPNSWNYWFAAPTSDRTNVGDRASIQPHPGPGPSPYAGSRALNISCGYFTCTAAIYQTVNNIQPGSNVQASAWSQVKACNLGGGTSCGSSAASGAQTRIGIDPTGGTDPNNPAIIWSAFTAPHDTWLQQSTVATATGSSVTVFLYSTQSSIADLNKTYWDDVVLTGTTTAPGSTAVPGVPVPTAVPTAPPYVAFVVPQGEQPDGSIVHTVQQGDTLDSIAYAYGTTRTAVLELNNLRSATFIFPGQKLIVKPPTQTAESAAGGESSAAAPTTAAAESTTVAAAPTTAPTQAAAVEPTAAPTEAPPVEPTAAEEQPTDGPTVTPQPTVPLPTAPVVVANAGQIDPAAVTAQVCVLLFDDANQNRIQEPGEALLAAGVVSLLKGTESVGAHTTDGVGEPFCFESLESADYVAVASAPEGYGLTTPDQLKVRLNPGATINLTFGAAQGVQPVQPPPADAAEVVAEATPQSEAPESIANQLLSVSGLLVFGLAGLVLVGGLGAAVLLRRR